MAESSPQPPDRAGRVPVPVADPLGAANCLSLLAMLGGTTWCGRQDRHGAGRTSRPRWSPSLRRRTDQPATVGEATAGVLLRATGRPPTCCLPRRGAVSRSAAETAAGIGPAAAGRAAEGSAYGMFGR